MDDQTARERFRQRDSLGAGPKPAHDSETAARADGSDGEEPDYGMVMGDESSADAAEMSGHDDPRQRRLEDNPEAQGRLDHSPHPDPERG